MANACQQAGEEHDGQGQHRAEARHVHAEHAAWLPGVGHEQQRLVERADDQVQHPGRDDQGDQDQQAGDEIFAHRIPVVLVGARR